MTFYKYDLHSKGLHYLKPWYSRKTICLPSCKHGEMIHATGVLHWVALNSLEGIGQEGGVVDWPSMSGSVLNCLEHNDGDNSVYG